MKSVSVFCGANTGTDPVYKLSAFNVGVALAQKGIHLVFGGGKVGLMGAVADGALSAGGKVTGVIPTFLKVKELAHEGLTELIVVPSMHERKMAMFELSEGTITLPGGFGSMDEIFEILTWGQLGLHQQPTALFNINGYYDALLAQMERMIADGFLKKQYREMLISSSNIETLIRTMEQYRHPEVEKWIVDTDMT